MAPAGGNGFAESPGAAGVDTVRAAREDVSRRARAATPVPHLARAGERMRVLIFAAAAVWAAGCGRAEPPDSARKDDKVTGPPVVGAVDLQVLAQDFANQAKGDNKYTGRRMDAFGFVKRVEKMDDGTYRVRFEYFTNGLDWGEGRVVAFFPAGEADKLAKYEYRQELRFNGRCDGQEGNVVVIRDCRVSPAPK